MYRKTTHRFPRIVEEWFAVGEIEKEKRGRKKNCSVKIDLKDWQITWLFPSWPRCKKRCGDYASLIILGVERWRWRYCSFVYMSFFGMSADHAFVFWIVAAFIICLLWVVQPFPIWGVIKSNNFRWNFVTCKQMCMWTFKTVSHDLKTTCNANLEKDEQLQCDRKPSLRTKF